MEMGSAGRRGEAAGQDGEREARLSRVRVGTYTVHTVYSARAQVAR